MKKRNILRAQEMLAELLQEEKNKPIRVWEGQTKQVKWIKKYKLQFKISYMSQGCNVHREHSQ